MKTNHIQPPNRSPTTTPSIQVLGLTLQARAAMISPQEFLRRRRAGLLPNTDSLPSEAYCFLTELISKPESESERRVPLADRSHAPRAPTTISFHSQLVKNRPMGVTAPELHDLGREAATLCLEAQRVARDALRYRKVEMARLAARKPGMKPLMMTMSERIEENLVTLMRVECNWTCPAGEDYAVALLERIEVLVRQRWAFEKSTRDLLAQGPLREGPEPGVPALEWARRA